MLINNYIALLHSFQCIYFASIIMVLNLPYIHTIFLAIQT